MSLSTNTPDLDNALQLIARQAQSLTLASGAAIALTWPERANLKHASDEMTCRASAGEDAPSVGARLRVGSGFSGECVRQGKLMRCDDAEADTRVDRDNCRRLGIRSMVAVPVKHRESVLGIIEIFSSLPKAFTESDIAAVQGLAQLVADAVEGAERAAPNTVSANTLGAVNEVTHLQFAPTPKLLLEREPAYRVFFRNLIDLLLGRTVPTVVTISQPEPFWSDVFVPAGIPWKRFMQSALWHMVMVVAAWNISQSLTTSDEILRRTIAHNSSVAYYRANPSFPSTGSFRPYLRPRPKVRSQPAPQKAMVVRTGSPQPMIAPPAVKVTTRARLSLVAWNPAIPWRAVPPAPTLGAVAALRQATLGSSGRPRLAQSSVVAPAPQVAAVFGQPGVAAPNSFVVAPSPSVGMSVRTNGNITIGHSTVVEPAPGMPLNVRSNISSVSLGGTGTVVGPAPGMPSHERANISAVSLVGAGAVIAPPPSMPERESSNISGATLNGTGTSVVPPPPSLTGSETLASGRSGSVSGVGSAITGPSPSLAGAGAFAGGMTRAARNIPPPVAPLPPREVEELSGPATQEVPLRLLGLALILPSSSYFSNYEVFIAERRVAKGETQLIKLVYESRPYQRRMSEYGLSDAKVYKLRVTRDTTCDETALQMTGDHYPELQTALGPRLHSIDRDSVLPCFRTTVDDYRKAASRGRP